MAAQDAQIPTPNTTSDTAFPGYLLEAAQILSTHLRQLGIDHAYIGGFAWSVLGSPRPTEDIDVMIKVENAAEMLALRDQLSGLNPRFATTTFKLYLSQVRTTKGSQVLSFVSRPELAPY